MLRRYIPAFALLTVIAAGCGHDGPGPNPFPDVVERCDNFVSNLCLRVAKCTENETHKSVAANFVDNCSDSWNTQRDCSDYPASPESHESCVSQLRSFSCDVLLSEDSLSLPATCNKIVDAWPE